jgi:hypothetical protein
VKQLADSWIDQDPQPTSSERFHDEAEEHDEVDELEDECGGVDWEQYALKKPNTSNKQLHELAREVRGVEKRRGRKFSVRVYQRIFNNWAKASKPLLRSGQDYFTEFLAKLNMVTVPKGETLRAAFDRARLREPPAGVSAITNQDVRQFASLCRELQEMAADQPIMLHQESIALLFGCSRRTIGVWIKALITLGLLQVAEPAVPNKRAARYSYRGK